MSRNGLYSLIGVACLLGALYFAISYFRNDWFEMLGWKTCFFKSLTGYPCPTCGTTRSVKLLFDGDLAGAFLMNPIGIVVGLLAVLVPSLLVYDLLFKKDTLHRVYLSVEKDMVKHKGWVVVFVILILLNGVWNVCKGI